MQVIREMILKKQFGLLHKRLLIHWCAKSIIIGLILETESPFVCLASPLELYMYAVGGRLFGSKNICGAAARRGLLCLKTW